MDVERQLEAAGLLLRGSAKITGKVERCKHESDSKGKSSGWYVLHEVTTRSGRHGIVGAAGSWKHAGQHATISTFDEKVISESERAELREEIKKNQEQQEKERLKLQQHAAEKANAIWRKLPDGGVSDYLNRKKVKPFGVKFSKRGTVVPLFDQNDSLVNLQFIYPDGTKRFLTGGKKQGCFHVIAGTEKVIFIAEGYATAASVHMATKQTVYVAFDAGNLKPVALAVRHKFPEARIVIAGDDDSGTNDNPGKTKAIDAARAVNGIAVFPDFGEAA